MVLDVEKQGVDWVGASRIFTTVVALAHISVFVLKLFVVTMMEVQRPELTWIVWYNVSVVHHTILLFDKIVWVCSIRIVTNSRLAKVNHCRWDTHIYQLHCSQLGNCTTQTVTSGLYLVRWIELLKSLNFSDDILEDGKSGIVEAFMNLTVAIRTGLVLDFVQIQICYEVLEGKWSSENYINWAVWG